MSINHRLTIDLLLASAFAVAGCAGPLTSDEIYDRLGRQGIPRPDDEASAREEAAAIVQSDLPVRGIELGDLLVRADQANPEIHAARSAVGVAAGNAWQAGMYPNPNVGVTSSEIGFEGNSANTIVGFTQPIVIGKRLRAAVTAADAEEAAQFADVERVRREVLGRVAELHAHVLELDAQRKLVDELLKIAEQTVSIAEARFEARAVSEPDVIRPRVEVYQLRADRQRIVHELAAAEKQLGLALDTEPIAAERLVTSISMNPDLLDESELVSTIDSEHPALIVADLRVEAAEAALARVRAGLVPDLNVSAGVGYSEEDEEGIAEFGIGAEIPLWDRSQGDIMAARFELMRRRQDKAAIRNRLLAELAESIGSYDAARDQLSVMRDGIVPDAQRAFDQIDESYRAGRASFIDLLDAQRTLMQSKRTQIELAGRASVSRAQIAAICGTWILFDSNQDHFENTQSTPTQTRNGSEDNR